MLDMKWVRNTMNSAGSRRLTEAPRPGSNIKSSRQGLPFLIGIVLGALLGIGVVKGLA